AARSLAEVVSRTRGARVDLDSVETNIVNIDLDAIDADAVVARARERGVLLNAIGLHAVRAVTHLDIPIPRAARAAELLAEDIEACAACAARASRDAAASRCSPAALARRHCLVRTWNSALPPSAHTPQDATKR